MAAAEELVLLAEEDKTVSLAVIPGTATPSTPASGAEAVTFRLVVEQRYRCGRGGADEVDTTEDVARRVPVAELRGAAAVDRAFEELLAGLDPENPALRAEVAPQAREAAARVRARCAEEVDRLGGAEFRLRVAFEESDAEQDCEETDSDLEFDEDSWKSGDWRHEDAPADLGDGQFSARPLPREGGASDGTLPQSGFEARADGPELADQHELTSLDMQRLLRLAFSGGDVEDDEGYQRAVDSGTPVSRVTRAVMLDQGLRSTRPQQQQPAPASARGMPPRMRTGW